MFLLNECKFNDLKNFCNIFIVAYCCTMYDFHNSTDIFGQILYCIGICSMLQVCIIAIWSLALILNSGRSYSTFGTKRPVLEQIQGAFWVQNGKNDVGIYKNVIGIVKIVHSAGVVIFVHGNIQFYVNILWQPLMGAHITHFNVLYSASKMPPWFAKANGIWLFFSK